MGVYIKDLEMPKHCWSCCFHDEVDDCIILKESCMTVWGEQKRLDNCPLIEVPKHGRLIDADALNYTMLYKENWMSGTGVEAPAAWKSDIDAAPTIIPAEPPKEET